MADIPRRKLNVQSFMPIPFLQKETGARQNTLLQQSIFNKQSKILFFTHVTQIRKNVGDILV